MYSRMKRTDRNSTNSYETVEIIWADATPDNDNDAFCRQEAVR
jgi:hypothetical protein